MWTVNRKYIGKLCKEKEWREFQHSNFPSGVESTGTKCLWFYDSSANSWLVQMKNVRNFVISLTWYEQRSQISSRPLTTSLDREKHVKWVIEFACWAIQCFFSCQSLVYMRLHTDDDNLTNIQVRWLCEKRHSSSQRGNWKKNKNNKIETFLYFYNTQQLTFFQDGKFAVNRAHPEDRRIIDFERRACSESFNVFFTLFFCATKPLWHISIFNSSFKSPLELRMRLELLSPYPITLRVLCINKFSPCQFFHNFIDQNNDEMKFFLFCRNLNC